MKLSRSTELKQFSSMPLWYTIRGASMIFFGAGVAVMCIIAPNVYMFGEKFSWIPVIGMIVIVVGFLRIVDAYMSDSVQGFLLNMQGGILDAVAGFLVLFSISGQPSELVLLIAGYMLTQGLLRNVLLSVVSIRNPKSNRITGIISIILGILIWLNWPTSAPWFLAFSLSADIGFRGWSLIMLASSIKMEIAAED
jgi:uncharacterized membrane protein HdeD (DUF308 family)